MKAIPVIITLIVFCPGIFAWGEKQDTLPNWYERAVLTLTNMCRINPQEYRDAFLKNDNILLPATYPPVPPLVWHYALNAASRYHAVEMAGNCGMQHNCNGMTFSERIAQFYSQSGNVGENIAAGYKTPQAVVNGWLVDRQQSGDTAADGSGNDGHRANIMSKKYTFIGCGFYLSGSGSSEKYLWCQDFAAAGKGTAVTRHGIPSGSHFFFGKDAISFMVNVFDTSLADPSVLLIINGSEMVMNPGAGDAGRRTCSFTMPIATVCRRYAFEVREGSVTKWRYPETGWLLTTGEGDCVDDYEDAASTLVSKRIAQPIPEFSIHQNELTVRSSGRVHPVKTRLFSPDGKLLYSHEWRMNEHRITISLRRSGVYVMVHILQSGSTVVTQFCSNR